MTDILADRILVDLITRVEDAAETLRDLREAEETRGNTARDLEAVTDALTEATTYLIELHEARLRPRALISNRAARDDKEPARPAIGNHAQAFTKLRDDVARRAPRIRRQSRHKEQHHE
jgi:hypothetical protein